MVHGIPCFDLSAASGAPKRPGSSISERRKWRISSRDTKQLHISLPINILGVEEDDNRSLVTPKPVEKDEKYLRPRIKQQFSGWQSPTSPDQNSAPEVSPTTSDFQYYINDDKSPAWSWRKTPSPKSYTIGRESSNTVASNVSDMSLKRKSRHPRVARIPEDLPCHQRYKPLSQSRSAHAPESQKTWSPLSSTSSQRKDIDEDEGWSDASSVYSQESSGAGTIFEQYPR